MEGVEPSTVALLAQRSNQLSYTTFLWIMENIMIKGLLGWSTCIATEMVIILIIREISCNDIKQSPLPGADQVCLLVHLLLNIPIFYRLNCVLEFFFFWIWSPWQIIVSERAFEFRALLCVHPWLIMPSIVGVRHSDPLSTHIRDLLPHFHVGCCLLGCVERPRFRATFHTVTMLGGSTQRIWIFVPCGGSSWRAIGRDRFGWRIACSRRCFWGCGWGVLVEEFFIVNVGEVSI